VTILLQHSQKLKIALKVQSEYNLPRHGAGAPTEGSAEGEQPAEEETPTPAAGKRKDPTDTTNILRSLETEKEEKLLRRWVRPAGVEDYHVDAKR
jgi:hypothetical protein